MKNFAKLMLAALCVILIASALSAVSSAEELELTPGSDLAIFIADGGTGTGYTADSPLAPNENPEGYDPTANAPKNHLKTAFYQGIDMLKEAGGGTLVICGPVYFGADQSYGTGTSQRDVLTPWFSSKTIKITSVYNGVDYRETNGAKITIEAPAQLSIQGKSIWENVTIETASADRSISFNNFETVIGEGVVCVPADDAFEGVAQQYISLAAGKRYSKTEPTEDVPNPSTHLVVKSGTYNKICGSNWGAGSSEITGVTTNLTIEGETTVLGQLTGTAGSSNPFGGNVNITINGGTFECDIDGGGTTAFTNDDAKVVITVNGGNFENVWSINEMSMNYKGSPAAYSLLDVSGYQGDEANLAAINIAKSEFTEVKWPEGFDPEAAAPATEPATEPATDAPEETASPETDGSDKAEDTKASETDAPVVVDNKDESGSNIGLIIGIIAGVVVIAGVVAGVIIAKKKKSAETK